VRRAPDVDWTRGAEDPTGADGADMVRVDFEADAMVPVAIDDEGRCPGGERFGQHDRGAAVKHARGLLGASVDWHPSRDIVVARFDELDAQVRNESVLAVLLDQLERKRFVPDSHGLTVLHTPGGREFGAHAGRAGSEPHNPLLQRRSHSVYLGDHESTSSCFDCFGIRHHLRRL